MKNRIPGSTAKAGWVTITGESPTITIDDRGYLQIGDTRKISGKIEHADDAVQEGSLYNVANVLPYGVCQALGIDINNSEPKDAFIAISNKISAAQNSINTLPAGAWIKVGDYRPFVEITTNLNAKAVLLDFGMEIRQNQSCMVKLAIVLNKANGSTETIYTEPFGIGMVSETSYHKFACEIHMDGGICTCNASGWYACLSSDAVSINKVSYISGTETPSAVVWKKV